jgi:dTDP-6-deoxy-L-talose 4-dehydrogenase (NAD+)
VRVAVTGGTGFVGRNVISELEGRLLRPILVLRNGRPVPTDLCRYAVAVLEGNDWPDTTFDSIGQPDLLIHLGWGGLPNYRSLHHFEEELPNQYRFLKRLIESGLRNLVVTGTCFEYGMQSGPLREDMGAFPQNPYGLAKDVLRRQLEFLQRAQGFDLTWARIFYVYGKGQAPTSLLPQIERAVQRGEREFPMSGGEQLRDYLHVGEAARYLVDLALSGGNPGVVNLCSGKPVSIRSLVEGWKRERGWDIEFRFGHYAYPDYEPMAFWGDRSKLERLLGRCEL